MKIIHNELIVNTKEKLSYSNGINFKMFEIEDTNTIIAYIEFYPNKNKMLNIMVENKLIKHELWFNSITEDILLNKYIEVETGEVVGLRPSHIDTTNLIRECKVIY